MVVSGKLIEIVERKGKGTQGSSYIYVAERHEREGILVHIGEYASVMKELSLGRRSYLVPINLLQNKILVRFSFSGSRLPYVEIGKIEDLELSEPVWEQLPPREFVEKFRGYRYSIQDEELKEMIDEFEEKVVPMVEDLREYEARLGFRISFMGKGRRVEEAYNDPEFYYFTSMSIPDDRSRKKSLRVTRRWIYQLWVLKEVCEALEVRRFYAWNGDKPMWWIERGSEISTFTAETPLGDVTFSRAHQLRVKNQNPRRRASSLIIPIYNRSPNLTRSTGFLSSSMESNNLKDKLESVIVKLVKS